MLREQLEKEEGQSDDDRVNYGSLTSTDPNIRKTSIASEYLSEASQSAFTGENIPNDDDENDDDISSEEEDDDDDEDSEISYDDSSDDEETALLSRRKEKIKCQVLQPIFQPIRSLYVLIRDAVILITNTDDVWDSPAFEENQRDRSGSFQSISSGGTYQRRQIFARQMNDPPSLSSEEPRVTLSHKFVVFFWFLILAFFYGLERFSFKVLADRMGPFRLVVGGEIVLMMHALMAGSFVLLRWIFSRKSNSKPASKMAMLPISEIGFMAILDTVQLLLLAISGSHVAPTLTAIIVHVSIPMTTYFNHVTGPNGCLYSLFKSSEDRRQDSQNKIETNQTESSEKDETQNTQFLFGVILIFISTFLALTPAILTLAYPRLRRFISYTDVMANRSAWNTILFFLAYIPGSISQVYKERTLASFAQPVDQELLNALLSFFSAVFAFLVSPLFYPLQGFADLPSNPDEKSELNVNKWIQQYPSRDVSRNFRQGLQCFTGTLSDDFQIRGYPEECNCDFAYGFVMLHVFSIIVVSAAVSKICNAGAIKILHKGISAGIILSVVSLFFYQVFIDDVEYGMLPNIFHISCAAVLVIGSEIYHRVTLEVPSFETEYPPAELYDD